MKFKKFPVVAVAIGLGGAALVLLSEKTKSATNPKPSTTSTNPNATNSNAETPGVPLTAEQRARLSQLGVSMNPSVLPALGNLLAQQQALKDQYNGLMAAVTRDPTNADTNAMAGLANSLEAAGLTQEASSLRALANMINDSRVSLRPPGGGPLGGSGNPVDFVTNWIATHPGCTDLFPHRDLNGAVFMWSDQCDGPAPPYAPAERLVG